MDRNTDYPVLHTLDEILSWHVVDSQDRKYRLADLAVDTTQDDPPVTHLFIRTGHKEVMLPWAAVSACEEHTGLLRLNLRLSEELAIVDDSTHTQADSVSRFNRLRRDLLDAWMLDVPKLQAARANMLLLQLWIQDGGSLRLCAVQMDMRALVHRLVRMLYRSRRSRAYHAESPVRGADIIDWHSIVFLRGTFDALSAKGADERAGRDREVRAQKLSAVLPAELARLSDKLPYVQTAEMLTLLSPDRAADMLEALALDRQVQVFSELDSELARAVLAHMAPDTAAGLLGQLPLDDAQYLLGQLPQKQRQRALDLLSYPSGTAASMMTNDVLVIPAHITAGEAVVLLRPRINEPDFATYVYVLDDFSSQRLCGVIGLRALVAADAAQPLTNLLHSNLITLSPLDLATPAAYRVLESQLGAVPVVGNNERLLGIVTIDAAISQVVPPQLRSQLPRIFS